MSAYVVPEKVPAGGIATCCLFADSLEELHAAALKLGLRTRAFCAGESLAHYELTARERVRAIRWLRAKPVNRDWVRARIREELDRRGIARPGAAA